MFSFLEEISSLTGLPFDKLGNGFRLINFSNNAVYVEGYSSLLSVTDSEIKVKLKKGILVLSGDNLKLKDMMNDSIMVVGNIKTMTVE